MPPIDKVIAELRKLSPWQVDEVARIIHDLSRTECPDEVFPHPGVATGLVDKAVEHGWPADLFRELIGSLPDLERPAQPPGEHRG